MDPRTPVLVGCAQITQRTDDHETAREPLELMEDAARAAAEDARAKGLLARVDSIRIPHGIWRYGNVAHRLAERLGIAGCETGVGPVSGSTVQIMLSRGAAQILAGERDVILLASAEAEQKKRRAKRAGVELPDWTQFGAWDPLDGSDGTPPVDDRFGGEEAPNDWWQKRFRPNAMRGFSLYENAMRVERGEDMAAHRARIAGLWARFAKVAAQNPYAWIRSAPSAEEIATPTERNRMVAYPYTKLMVANMVVDQAAALLLCSKETADRFEVPEARRVYPHASAEVTKTHEISARPNLYSTPAIGLVGRKAYALAGATPAEIDHVDLYSCFPAAVQMAAAELELSLERDLTVTGGLTFSGGPLNSYVMHSISAMVERLRAGAPGERGLVSSIGGFIAKHAVAIYGNEPAEHAAFRHARVDEEAAQLPRRSFVKEHEGKARVETFAVDPGSDRSQPELLLSCQLDDGARVWAVCPDPDILEGVGREEICGRDVRIDLKGTAEFV